MTEGTGSSQIFISYAHEDVQLAEALAKGLEEFGWLVWWDPKLHTGQSFRTTIAEALAEVGCVIVLWSKDSIKSNWVPEEAQRGMDRGVLLPILLDVVKPPIPFGALQTADFTSWAGSTSAKVFKQLVKRIRELAGAPPRLVRKTLAKVPEGIELDGRKKLVILFDHDDSDLLQRKGSNKVSRFLKFLEVVAPPLGLEVWWDENRQHPGWDPEIEKLLDEAAVVLFVSSVSLLTSSYVTNLRAQRTYFRLARQNILMIQVRYETIPGHAHNWLSEMIAVPKEGMPLEGRDDKTEIYKELTDLIQRELRGRTQPIRDGKAMRTLRNSPESEHTDTQLRAFREDACNRAFKYVPDPTLRDRICAAARKMGAVEGGWPPLSKKQLTELDGRFTRKEKRKPDPKKIRWVLRCHNLHPQTKSHGRD